MVPFVLLLAAFFLLTILGWLGVPFSFGRWMALRISLAAMFLLTATLDSPPARSDPHDYTSVSPAGPAGF